MTLLEKKQMVDFKKRQKKEGVIISVLNFSCQYSHYGLEFLTIY